MKTLIKREYLYGSRNSKFLILGFMFLFFAISTPIMIKVLLPAVLRSQFPGMGEAELAMMIDISQTGSMISYMKNVFEVGLIIFGFTLSGLMASELKEHTLVMPICSGTTYRQIILSKFVVNAVFIVLITFVSFGLTYLYSSVLFENEFTYAVVFKASLLESLLFLFILSLIITLGTLFHKPIATGLLSVGAVYLLSLIGGIFKINRFLPTGLHIEANYLNEVYSNELLIGMGITVVLIVILLFASVKKLEYSEWNQR